MSITTKKGDKGKTSLLWGGRVSKDDARVDTYGMLDELCSYLGMSKSLIVDKKARELITSIQRDLFVIGAEIATGTRFIKRLRRRVSNLHIKRLEDNIERLEHKKPFKECCFYLPGENLLSSTLDVARTVARRVERRVVTLKRSGFIKNNYILIYLNRLSDLLYLMARGYERRPQELRYE